MKKHVSRRPSLHFSAVVLLLLILTFLQGCNALVDSPQETQFHSNLNPSESHDIIYLRPPPDSLLPDSSNTTLLLELSSSATENPGLTRRIELEYGVLRRLLKRYGVDIQVLEAHNLSRDDLNEHASITRLLKRYGITPQVLSSNGDQLTDALLSEYSVTDEDLLFEGVTDGDIAQFNSFNALLNLYQTTVEDYARDQRSTTPEVDALNFTQRIPSRLRVSLNNSIVEEVMTEMSDDPDILRIQEAN